MPEGKPAAKRRSVFDPIGRIIDTVVPTVADAVDVDDIIERIDIDALLARIDIDDLMSRIDVEALIGRIDVNDLMGRIDMDTLLGRIDLNRLMCHVDVNALVGRVDADALMSRVDLDALLARVALNELLDRVDVDRILDRVDADRVLARVDLDAVMQRVDIDAIIDKVDIDKIVQRADLAGIVAQSTRGITGSLIDLVRRQIVGVDEIITRVAARASRRDPDTYPAAPPELIGAPTPTRSGNQRPSISGHYAGPIARLAAFALDWFALLLLFGLATAIGSWTLGLVFGRDSSSDSLGTLWSTLLLIGWAAVYFMVPLSLTGKTLGKAVVGLRVVRRDGSPLRSGQAVVRELVLPFSILIFGLGLLGGVFGRERRTWHDMAGGSTEVIDWGDRPAALPNPLDKWLQHRQEARTSLPGVEPVGSPSE